MTQQQEIEIVNKAIAKMSAIPASEFTSRMQYDDTTAKRCFVGHYGAGPKRVVSASFQDSIVKLSEVEVVNSRELLDIGVVTSKYLYPKRSATPVTMVHINNGDDDRYQQPTEKERIMAALMDVKQMILTQNPPVDELIEQATAVKEHGQVTV